jgi:hypothetical protein
MKPLTSLKPSFYLLSLLCLFIGSCDKEQLHTNSTTFEVITNEIVSPIHAASVDENNFVVVGQNSEKGLVHLVDKQGIINQVFGFKGPYQSMLISEIQVDRQNDTYFICGSGRRAANQKDSILLVYFKQKFPLDNYILLKRQGNASSILLNPDRTLILSGATEGKAFLQKIDYTGKRIWLRQYIGTTALKTFENPKDTSEIISFILDGGNVDIAYINRSTGVEKRREELDLPFKSFPLNGSFAIADNGDVLVADGIIEGLLANGDYFANTVIYRWDNIQQKIKWEKSFPKQYVMQKIKKLDDQGYIVWGNKINSKNAVLVKLNADGEVEWERIYPEIRLNSVLPAKDKGFYLIGTTTSNKLYLAKTGQWGNR